MSITDPAAAKEIHRFRSEYLKTQFYEDSNFSSAQNILTTTDPAYHARLRKLMGPAASQSNLIKFQPVIQKHIDVLILQLERQRECQGYVDVVKWFKNFTSDVTAELSIGSSLDMLETGEVSETVELAISIHDETFVRKKALSQTDPVIPRKTNTSRTSSASCPSTYFASFSGSPTTRRRATCPFSRSASSATSSTASKRWQGSTLTPTERAS